MRRRELIALFSGAAAAWPLAAWAQQDVSVVGFLTPLGKGDRPNLREAFRRGLSEDGYVEGRNVSIEYSFAVHPDAYRCLRHRARLTGLTMSR